MIKLNIVSDNLKDKKLGYYEIGLNEILTVNIDIKVPLIIIKNK